MSGCFPSGELKSRDLLNVHVEIERCGDNVDVSLKVNPNSIEYWGIAEDRLHELRALICEKVKEILR